MPVAWISCVSGPREELPRQRATRGYNLGTTSAKGTTVRGIVKTFDAEQGIGIILGEMGRKYPVTLADAVQPQALVTGQLVHFSIRFVGIHGFATNVGIRQADPMHAPSKF